MLPAALAAQGEALAAAFVQSLTMGAGQFCTNPGLLIGIAGPALDRFAAAAGEALGQTAPATMLTPGIAASFDKGVAALERHDAVAVVARAPTGEGVHQARGALFAHRRGAFPRRPGAGA